MPRPKGVPNVLSGTAKENIAAVFTRLGPTAAMAKWAKRHQTEFYKLYARLVPVEQHLSGELGSYTAQPIPVAERHPLDAPNGPATNGHSTS